MKRAHTTHSMRSAVRRYSCNPLILFMNGMTLTMPVVQCISGTDQDGYRRIRVGSRIIECCKSTCCSETTRVQVALNGKDWIPSQTQYQAEPYILLENSPDVQFTMYVEPYFNRVEPPVGPMRGSTTITVFGSSFITGSLNVSKGRTFCQFRVLQEGRATLQDEETVAQVSLPPCLPTAVRQD